MTAQAECWGSPATATILQFAARLLRRGQFLNLDLAKLDRGNIAVEIDPGLQY
jgi:hypothetical protein